jgi:hypothetical protein
MYLQLHDGPGMASQRYPSVPDLRLPDALKISNRAILLQAIEEGGELALKELQKIEASNDPAGANIDENVITELEKGGYLGEKYMGGPQWVVILAKVGKFLLKYGKLIYEGLKSFAKTVRLKRVNAELDVLYDQNMYGVQRLNEMTPQQIDQQLKIMSVDLINANADKNQQVEALALTRFIQVYQMRKIQLPIINQRTLLMIGAGVLAFMFLRKK